MPFCAWLFKMSFSVHEDLGEAFYLKMQVLFGTLQKHLQPHDFLTLKCERTCIWKTLLSIQFICFASALTVAQKNMRGAELLYSAWLLWKLYPGSAVEALPSKCMQAALGAGWQALSTMPVPWWCRCQLENAHSQLIPQRCAGECGSAI